MTQSRKRFQIPQRRKRRAKNTSFKRLSAPEVQGVKAQQRGVILRFNEIKRAGAPVFDDARSLAEIERFHSIKFKQLFAKLRSRFKGETLEVLDEGAGRSPLHSGLALLGFGGNIGATTTDIREDVSPDVRVNAVELADRFGKGRFHLVVSTASGTLYSPVPEKAIFQVVSTLKPGGMGVITVRMPRHKLDQLAQRFNISIGQVTPALGSASSVVFTKNIGKIKRNRAR